MPIDFDLGEAHPAFRRAIPDILLPLAERYPGARVSSVCLYRPEKGDTSMGATYPDGTHQPRDVEGASQVIVACRISNGIDIGGFVLKGNYIGPEFPAKPQPPNPPRERIAGFEITRNVPTEIWERWVGGGGASLVRAGVVFGSDDEVTLAEWCWAHRQAHGHSHGAPQGDANNTVPGPPSINSVVR
jgi:hypothetical protein